MLSEITEDAEIIKNFRKIYPIIASRNFFLAILLLFVIQGMTYAFLSKYGLPPDEKFHFESIQYFAAEPLATGPFIDNQPPETIKDVNVIERSATYFYHYLLSFPARLMNGVDIGFNSQILVFRTINVLLCLLTLMVLKKVLDELSDNNILKNLSVAALSLTGIFVFLSGSINYDNLANLLFVAFILFITRSVKRAGQNELAWAVIFGLATVLTKYTFLPIIALGLLASAFFVFKQAPNRKQLVTNIKRTYSANRWATLACAGLLLVFTSLAVERVGINLIQYKQVQPSCRKIFTSEQCYENFAVYRRGVDNKANFNQEGGLESTNFSMFTQTGEWTDRMYTGLYYYFGQHRVENYIVPSVVAFLFLTTFGLTLFFRRQKMNLKREHLIIIGLTAAYFILLYLFNLKTYLFTGERSAYQGRYLIPAIGFIYFFAGLIIFLTYKKLSKFRSAFIIFWSALIILMFVAHFPALNFYRYVQDSKGTPYQLKSFDIRYTERPTE